MDSIISKDNLCYLCGARGTCYHHIFGGVSNRPKSEARGFKVRLCDPCHRKLHSHINSGDSLKLKQFCQSYYESNYGTRKDFIREFGKNRLEDE